MSGFLFRNAWLVPFLPLLGTVITAAGGRWLKERSHWPVILGIGLSCVVSMGLLFSLKPAERRERGSAVGTALEVRDSQADDTAQVHSTVTVYRWIDAGDLHIPIELRIDGLSTMMISMVTLVSLIIAIFSVGYMSGDPGYARFFAEMGLFVAAMTTLVLSNNFVLTYVGWEGVGVCSYLLIGFWYAKPSAADAAVKAFLVNRIGDVGFAIALFWLWSIAPDPGGGFSRLSYDNILNTSILGLFEYWERTRDRAAPVLGGDGEECSDPALYLAARRDGRPDARLGVDPRCDDGDGRRLPDRALQPASGKRAHCPAHHLHHRLCHGSARGGHRGHADGPEARAGLLDGQSTRLHVHGPGAGVGSVGQLAVVAGMFHLFTHAFFKALLFLSSGSVMHSMGGVIDMRRFGGLRHRMPYTCWTFAVGGLALAGIVPFAGFWSKDEVLSALKLASEAAEVEGLGWGVVYTVIYWTAIFTAFLTAFYTGRAFFLTFFGPEKLPSPDDPEAQPEIDAVVHPHPVLPVDTPAPETAQAREYAAALGSEAPAGLDEAAMRAAAAAGFAVEQPDHRDPHRPADLPRPTPAPPTNRSPSTGTVTGMITTTTSDTSPRPSSGCRWSSWPLVPCWSVYYSDRQPTGLSIRSSSIRLTSRRTSATPNTIPTGPPSSSALWPVSAGSPWPRPCTQREARFPASWPGG